MERVVRVCGVAIAQQTIAEEDRGLAGQEHRRETGRDDDLFQIVDHCLSIDVIVFERRSRRLLP
jgi:hypothetical protein